MRNELDNIERIENYLTGKLSETEAKTFEAEMNINAELKEQVDLQRNLMEGITRASLVQSAQKAHGKYKLGKGGINWGLGGFAILVVAAAAWFFTTQTLTENSDNLRYSKNEIGTEQFADADKFIPSQLFAVDGGKDTVIHTQGGITMTILANTFLDDDGNPITGNLDLEVKEALDPMSIMKGGLTTMSGNRLLESGGMFYVNGRQGNKSLRINPEQGIYTQVPTDKKQPNMQLFDGKRLADGTIDWVNPKPLETFLTPVEITTLDFYPPDYLDELGKRGYDNMDKEFTDSLYYSYASEFGGVDIVDEINGENLFRSNCTSCHAVNHVVVAPALAGTKEKWSRYESSLYDWMRDPYKYGQENPSDFIRSVERLTPSVMTAFNLTDEEFDAIFDYVDSFLLVDSMATESDLLFGINPASIKTIWNEKFNNTNLATKEFEERLAHIHNTCDEWILDYYTENLDKRLSTLDSAVAQKQGSDVADKFWEFARRGDGRVETDNKYAQFLKGYYHRQAKIEAEAIKLVREKYNADNLKKQQEANDKRNKQNANELERYSRNWQEEYQTNLKEAYRQLGYPPAPPRGIVTNNAVVTNSGWNNVDKYVAESVTNRTTLDYTDKDGNRAVIKYEPISLEITNATEFDRVLVYMLPNDLYSFQRLKKEENRYSETLNELYEYDVLCIGFKGEENFIHHIKKAQPKDYGSVKLKRIGKMQLEKKLYAIKDYSVQRNLKEDLAYQKFEIKEQKRMEKLMEKEQLRNEMYSVVFPCSPQFFTGDTVALLDEFEVVEIIE